MLPHACCLSPARDSLVEISGFLPAPCKVSASLGVKFGGWNRVNGSHMHVHLRARGGRRREALLLLGDLLVTLTMSQDGA